MKRIPLTQGKYAIVDDDDYEELKQYKWYPHHAFNLCYAVRHTKCVKGERGLVYMHRQILNAPKGVMVDHKNRKGLDNRKQNIRLCNNSKNQGNSKKQSNNTSGFKGVSWHKNKKMWIAHIRINGKLRHLGYFDDCVKAAKSYDEAAKDYFGKYALLNF